MNLFNSLQKQFYISKEPVKQLETEYPCLLCKVNTRCYYIENITYHGSPAYICNTSYKQLQMYRNYIMLMHEFIKYVDYDCINYIIRLFSTINPNQLQCVQDKAAIIKYRNDYITMDFISLYTIPQLKALIEKRGLFMPKSRKQRDYINVLRNDMSAKYRLWRSDNNYPLYS
jgi:hypothetical protein